MTQTIEMPVATGTVAPATVRRRRRTKAKPSCGTCFFDRHGLCALDLDEPCATFRPDGPDGLRPPTQPALLARDA